jgi:hypothetical protein
MQPADRRWGDLEDRAGEATGLLFRRRIGLDVDHAAVERATRAVRSLAEEMAPSCRADPDAWSRLCCLILNARLVPGGLELNEPGRKHLTFEDILLDGKPVTPRDRRKVLRVEDDPRERRALLSRLAEGHPAVDEAIQRRREVQRFMNRDRKAGFPTSMLGVAPFLDRFGRGCRL